MILHDKKLIFVHIPKTAGMSISKTFGQKWTLDNHKLAIYYDKKEYDDYSKFAIVRNPYSRLVSTYNYIKSKPYYRGKTICGPGDNLLPFSSWLIYNLESYEGTFSEVNVNAKVKNRFKRGSSFWFSPQYYWLYNINNELQVDHLLRIENLRKEFDELMNTLNLSDKLLHVNRTNKVKTDTNSYRDYYDDYIRNMITTFYRIDLLKFSYTF